MLLCYLLIKLNNYLHTIPNNTLPLYLFYPYFFPYFLLPTATLPFLPTPPPAPTTAVDPVLVLAPTVAVL